MNYDCPKCGESLKWKRIPTRILPKGEKWVKARDSEFYCPFCDTGLSENRSKMEWIYITISTAIIIIGGAFVFILGEITDKQYPWALVVVVALVLILDGLYLRYIYKNKLKNWTRWKANESKL